MMQSAKPDEPCIHNYVGLRDFFTLWLERLEMFYDSRFEGLEERTSLALTASDKAVTKAETATEKRFEGVNEFRQTLADQAARFLPREEAQIKFDNIQKELSNLTKEIQDRRNQLSDKAVENRIEKQSWIIPMIVVGIISIGNLIINILSHKP